MEVASVFLEICRLVRIVHIMGTDGRAERFKFCGQEIVWETKEIELAGKTIDCIWNGMTLDPEREANMACTVPYVKNAQVPNGGYRYPKAKRK